MIRRIKGLTTEKPGPRAARTSALPHRLATARLAWFAPRAPAAGSAGGATGGGSS